MSKGDLMVFVAFGAAIGLVILIRVLAGTNTILGKICRWFWNTSHKLGSYIPFCGWMAHFIIADKAAKKPYVDAGRKVDDYAIDRVQRAAEAERARRERDERIRSQLHSRGLRDVVVSDDGTYATAKDKQGKTHTIPINYN